MRYFKLPHDMNQQNIWILKTTALIYTMQDMMDVCW
jgi:hypothetical protein